MQGEKKFKSARSEKKGLIMGEQNDNQLDKRKNG